jgi:uncharacterized protein (DUF4415 family)
MKMADIRKLTAEEQAALDAVADMSDERINTADPDAPEVKDWSRAQRGVMFQKFYRPEKRPVTMRLDADIIHWFSQPTAEGYQTRINAALREYIEIHDTHGK